MIERVFPADVVTVTATPAMWEVPLHPKEALCVARAVDKRKREFTAGRACARVALARLGIRDFPLLSNAEDRTPIWPPGIAGSISHTAGCCGVAVARIDEIRGIGYDVEESKKLDRRLLADICTPAEIDRLSEVAGTNSPVWSELDWAKVVFSAKESFYKCYYPLAQTYLGFHDAEIDLFPEESSFVARLIRPDAPDVEGHREIHGRFARDSHHIFTGVTVVESASEVPETPAP
jgi:4'-phosphopantetheinyl transferase EntD